MCVQHYYLHVQFLYHASSSSSLGSRCVPWLGEGLSMLSPNYPVLCFPLPYRVAPVFVQVVSPSLGWSPLSSFLVIWSPTGDTRGPSVVFEAVDMPCPGPFHFFFFFFFFFFFYHAYNFINIIYVHYLVLTCLSLLLCSVATVDPPHARCISIVLWMN